MSKTEKDARLHIRLRSSDKERIKRLARKCNLSVGEYVIQRALGFVPVVVQPEALYLLNNSLINLLNKDLTPEIEKSALRLFDEIHNELFSVRKEGDVLRQPQAFGP